MGQTDGRTDGRQIDALRLTLDEAKVIIPQISALYFLLQNENKARTEINYKCVAELSV